MSRGEFEETSAGMLRCLGKRRQLAKLDANKHRQLRQFHPYSDLKTSPEHQGASTLQKHRQALEQGFQPVMGTCRGATGNGLL